MMVTKSKKMLKMGGGAFSVSNCFLKILILFDLRKLVRNVGFRILLPTFRTPYGIIKYNFKQHKELKSCFILASNQLDMKALSDKQLIEGYKEQQKVERGFMKDPMFMAQTMFLKSTKRIMALLMVMTICLLVYAALEHRIRQALKEHDEYFPDQKGNAILSSNHTLGISVFCWYQHFGY